MLPMSPGCTCDSWYAHGESNPGLRRERASAYTTPFPRSSPMFPPVSAMFRNCLCLRNPGAVLFQGVHGCIFDGYLTS